MHARTTGTQTAEATTPNSSVATTVVRSAARPARKMGDSFRQVSWLTALTLGSGLPEGAKARRQWQSGTRLAAYSCGGSRGLGASGWASTPHRVPFSPDARHIRNRYDRATKAGSGCAVNALTCTCLHRATCIERDCALPKAGAGAGYPANGRVQICCSTVSARAPPTSAGASLRLRNHLSAEPLDAIDRLLHGRASKPQRHVPDADGRQRFGVLHHVR